MAVKLPDGVIELTSGNKQPLYINTRQICCLMGATGGSSIYMVGTNKDTPFYVKEPVDQVLNAWINAQYVL